MASWSRETVEGKTAIILALEQKTRALKVQNTRVQDIWAGNENHSSITKSKL